MYYGHGGGLGILSREANPDSNRYINQLRTFDDGYYNWIDIPGSYFEGEGYDVIYNYYIEEFEYIPVCIVNKRKN
jgi:hypothetical protein